MHGLLNHLADLGVENVLPDVVGISTSLSGRDLRVFADVVSHIRIELAGFIFLRLAQDGAKHRRTAVRAPNQAGKDMDVLRAVASLRLYAGPGALETYLLPEFVRNNRIMLAVEQLIIGLLDAVILVAGALDLLTLMKAVDDFTDVDRVVKHLFHERLRNMAI